MATDKRINYEMQGKVKNYLGNQKTIKAPLRWQSAPNHPTTELAYITKKEKDLLIKKDLHKSLKGGVNRGPSGIISLNGWGDKDEGFADKSFAGQERPGRDVQVTTGSPHTAGPRTVTQRTKTVSPKDTFEQSWSGPKRFFGLTGGYRNLKTPGVTPERGGAYQSRIGGLGRGLLSLLGGVPGRIASGLSAAKNWATRTQPIVEEEENITSDYRINPTTGQYEYVGGSMDDTMKEFRQKYPLNLRNVNTDNQTDYNKIGIGDNYGIDEADAMAMGSNNNPYTGEDNWYNQVGESPMGGKDGGRIGYQDGGSGGSYVDYVKAMNALDMEPIPIDIFDSLTGFMSMQEIMDMGSPEDRAQGGRIGYRGGELVDENINVEGPNFDFNENIEMAEGPDIDELIEARVQELMDEGLDWGAAMAQAKREFGMAEGEEEAFSEEGIASVV